MNRSLAVVKTSLFVFVLGGCLSMVAGCSDSSKTDECASDEANIGGDCLQKCKTAVECVSEDAECVETVQDFKVCTIPEEPDADTGPRNDTGGGPDDTGSTTDGETDSGPDTDTESTPDTNDGGTCMDLPTCRESNCSNQEGADGELCLLEHCGTEYEECNRTGSRSCDDVYACRNQCSDGDSDCKKNCTEDGTLADQKTYQRLAACRETNCGEETGPLCVYGQCGDHYVDCGATGSQSCDEWFRCRQRCESGSEESCFDDCGTPTEQAIARLGPLYDCFLSNCRGDSDPSCPNEQCGTAWSECGLTGQNSCKDVAIATDQCSDGDDACRYDALYDGTNDAQAGYLDLTACRKTHCANESSDAARLACTLASCKTEWESQCELTGQGSCLDILNCQQNNGDECVYEADFAGQEAYAALTICIEENCPQQSRTCIQNNCGQELNACQMGN